MRDFSWNLNDHLYIASTDEENNIVQIWQMASHIYEDEKVL